MRRTNSCLVVGNLGSEPAIRSQGDKGPVIGFSLAEDVTSFDEESKSYRTIHTNWFHITAFGSLAERVKQHLKKGDRVCVQGRMKTSEYVDAKSKEKKSWFEILADDITISKILPGARAVSQKGHELEQEMANEESLPF